MTVLKTLQMLGSRQVIVPHLESSLMSENWPDSYTVEIDSSPYYGTGDGYFHPSSHCLPSAYYLWHQLNPDAPSLPEQWPKTVEGQLSLAMGTALHAITETQMIMCGLVKDKSRCEVEFVSERHHGRGHMDFVIDEHPNGKTYPVEFKTQNSRAFYDETRPKRSWVYQLNCYMDWGHFQQGVVLVATNGAPFSYKEFAIEPQKGLLTPVYQKWEYVYQCLKEDREPEKCCEQAGLESHQCPRGEVCWTLE